MSKKKWAALVVVSYFTLNVVVGIRAGMFRRLKEDMMRNVANPDEPPRTFSEVWNYAFYGK